MPLVVLTYPGHFYFTTLTIRSYLRYHPTPSNIIILIDNLSPHAWSSYTEDCQQHYAEFNPKIVKTSQLPFLKNFFRNGWIRQQMIKLYLDQLVPADEWFYTDGDIIFLNTVEHNTVPYSEPAPGEVGEWNQIYVSNMLGLTDPGVFKNNQRVCVSNPAFRTMHGSVLKQLRAYVEQQHNKAFDQLHEHFQTRDTSSMSEWELIENFKYHVQSKTLDLVKYAPHDYLCISQKLNFFKHQFLTCYCTDNEIGADWFETQGISNTQQFWNRVEKITR